jgi:mono/diheme cytochrome c family protein
VDFLAVKAGLVFLALLLVAACDWRETAEQNATVTESSKRQAPPSVSYQQYPSAGKLEPQAETLTNPLVADPNAAQQGQVLFAAMNCDGCHGGGAVGFVGPSLVDGRWRYGGDDGALFHSIFYGRPRGMPAYGGLLNEATVWQLISYLRAQPVPGVVPTVVWQ